MITKSIFIFLFILLAKAEWRVEYDGLNDSILSSSDLAIWSKKLACNTNNECIGDQQYITCDQNPNQMISIHKDCGRWVMLATSIITPHFQMKLIAGIYLIAESIGRFRIVFSSTREIYRIYPTTLEVPFSKLNCWNGGPEYFNNQVIVREFSHVDNTLRIAFCYETSELDKFVGLRNVQILMNACHWSCRACDGEGVNQCTLCYHGTPEAGVCPNCPGNYQYIDVEQPSCLQECPRTKLWNFNKVCYANKAITEFITHFSNNDFSTYGTWQLIPDPYYSLLFENRFIQCGQYIFFGPFYMNEGIKNQFSFMNASVTLARFRMTFFLSNFDDQTQIRFFLNEICREKLYFENGVLRADLSTVLVQNDLPCGKVVRVEFQLPLSQIQARIKIQGNMGQACIYPRLGEPQQWGIRDFMIDQIICQINCAKCSSFTSCEICEIGYYNYRGACDSQCPKYSTVLGQTCIDFEDSIPYPSYLIKAFYDTSSTLDTQVTDIVGEMTNFLGGNNQITGQIFGYMANKRVLGGPLSWHQASFTKTFTNLSPFYGYRIKIKIYLGEGAGTFTYALTGMAPVTITPSTAASEIINLSGRSAAERIYNIDHEVTILDQSNQITIVLSYTGPSQPELGFGAVSDYFLILFKCMPFCNQCTSATECSAWATADESILSLNPLTCQPARYLDKTQTPYTCLQCASNCATCSSPTNCQSCLENFYLLEGICYCYTGYYQVGIQCLACSDLCLDCSYTSTSCISCRPSQNRILSKQSCLCKPYYMEVSFSKDCQPICGDMVVVGNEQCDDGNNIPFDGCFQCSFSCPLNCKTCSNNNCTSCFNGFYFNAILKKCVSICGDIQLNQNQEYYDATSKRQQQDYLCIQQCENFCLNCFDGNCLNCQKGFLFNHAVKKCDPICGDGLIVHEEQCDDGNLDAADGCWNCQIQCSFACSQCVSGRCLSCKPGSYLTKNNSCIAICENQGFDSDPQCDNGSFIEQNGCFICQKFCDKSCLFCQAGICIQCQQGWQINSLGHCDPICKEGVTQSDPDRCNDKNQCADDWCQQSLPCHYMCLSCQQGICYDCNRKGWELQNNSCVETCGDSIIVGYEECDDGNSLPFDGCYQCQFQCHEHCLKCKSGICMECALGWQKYDNQCKSICGDGILTPGIEVCDDGNNFSIDGCSEQCTVEQNWQCFGPEQGISECFISDQPNFLLSIIRREYDSGLIELHFTCPLKLHESNIISKMESNPKLSAQLIDQIDQEYDIKIVAIVTPQPYPKNVKYHLMVSYLSQIERPRLKVEIKHNFLVSEYNEPLAELTKIIGLTSSKLISFEDREMSIKAQIFANNAIISIGAVSIISILTGSISLFQSSLDQLQLLSYLKYINIEFPENLQVFFQAFDIVTIDPILDMLGVNLFIDKLIDLRLYFVPSHGKFAKENLNALFLYNFRSFLFCCFLGYANIFVCKLFYYSIQSLSNFKQTQIKNIVNFTLRFLRQNALSVYQNNNSYSWLITLSQTNFYDIIFSILLQLRNHTNISFLGQINIVLSILFLTIILNVTLITFQICFTFVRQTTTLKLSAYEALFTGVKFKNQNFWSYQYNQIILIKKMLFMVILILFQDCGIIQTLLISLTSMLFVCYVILVQPLADKYEGYKIYISESLVSFNLIFFLFYSLKLPIAIAYGEELIIGWINICGFGTLVCSILMIDLLRQLKKLLGKYKQGCTKSNMISSMMQKNIPFE